MMNYGWICPKCGSVMSPTTTVCVSCNISSAVPSYTWSINPETFYDPPQKEQTKGNMPGFLRDWIVHSDTDQK